MVATTDRYASEVGAAVLEAGGNAIDATVAAAFALAVVNPEAGNLGGSGFLLARMADGRTEALDCRSVAPAAATPDMFLAAEGGVSEQSQVGPLAAATPGAVRGLWDAHETLGTLPWKDLLEPAIALARGFRVEERLVRSYAPHIVSGLRRFPQSAQAYLPEGRIPRFGDTFRQPDLARTLERIRDGGADEFYRGATAELLVSALKREGGILELSDLASYESARREPISCSYRGHTILSMPPSSSGGVALAETAHILAVRDVSSLPWHGPEHVHLLAEAWRRAFADRNRYLADSDFADVPVETLASPAYGARRGLEIEQNATPSERVGPGLDLPEFGHAGKADGSPRLDRHHTTHVSVVDAAGNAVAMTTTLNTWFGSKWVAAGTGILMNNEMDDFTLKPGEPNHFGLVQGVANSIEPRKRMLSAMTPTIVTTSDGALALVVGAPGGATIITTVFQVISNILDHGMVLADAVAAPRVHHQHLPDRLDVEPGGLQAHVVSELQQRGHTVREQPEPWGDVQAVSVHENGSVEGASDPRRGGVAVGV